MWRLRMRKGRLLLTGLLAAALLALTACALSTAETLQENNAGISLRLSDGAVAEKKLHRLLRQEAGGPLACTAAWTRGGTATAEAPSMETSASLRIIAVYGDMRQVAPLRLLSGSFPAEDDLTGCLLDQRSAEALFRSLEITGAKVTLDGKPYVVRGVAEGGEPMALIRQAEASYENLEFATADLSGGKGEAEAFLYRHALSDAYVCLESGLYARMMGGLAWLPVALPLAAAGIRLLCGALRRRKTPGLRLLKLAAGLACAAALALLLDRTVYWPEIFLPTKCVDFAFWGTLVAGWRETWERLCLAVPLPRDVLFYRQMRGCLVCIAAALAVGVGLIGVTGCGSGCNQEKEKNG